MPEVHVNKSLDATAQEVWAVVGDFWALDVWHPMVPNCHKVDDSSRMIKLPGLSPVETLIPDECGEHKHVYTVENSPMPMRNYRGQLEVLQRDQGCVIQYTGHFDPPEGVEDAGATSSMLRKFFERGFEALAQRLREEGDG